MAIYSQRHRWPHQPLIPGAVQSWSWDWCRPSGTNLMITSLVVRDQGESSPLWAADDVILELPRCHPWPAV